MNVDLPLNKVVENITVDEDFQDRDGSISMKAVEHVAVVQDDASSFLNLLAQVNWNDADFKNYRRDMTKVIKQLRRYNFDNSRRVSKEGFITLSWERVRKLKEILLDKYPKDKEVSGANTLISLDDFEEWYDVKVVEMKNMENGSQEEQNHK